MAHGIEYRVILLFLFLAAAVPAGAAQAQRDAQAAYEPRSGPGAGQKFLEKFVGDWDVVKSFYPRSGKPVATKGECRQTVIHEGRFLRSEFVFEQGGTRTSGLGLIGFEAEPGVFTSVWTDSRATRMSMRQSRGRFNGEEIVLYSRSLDAGESEARQSRTVTRLEDGGRTILHRQYTLGPDGNERLVMELRMTRRADPAQPGK